jgi:two-component system, OmpR family, phosphate regulon sensor histidine kinase PhoR
MIDDSQRDLSEQETVFLSLREGVLVIDADERILKMNDAAGRINHVDPSTARGRSIEEVLRNAELLRFVRQGMRENRPVEGEVVWHGERELILKVYVRALEGERAKHGILVVLNDITQLRRLETMRRDFVANVSHELKTPITSIQGSVETLLDGALDKPADALKFVSMIGRQAERLNLIFDDLLILSRLEQDDELKNIYRARQFLQPILVAACELCAERAEERHIALTLECDPGLEATVSASLLQQAVVNLVDNAIKYTGHDGNVKITASGKGNEVYIEVADQGPGIPPAHLSRIFERFYRVDPGRGRKAGGTGLGLAIVKHICQVHGGGVTVRSEVGKGSAFTIRIPSV